MDGAHNPEHAFREAGAREERFAPATEPRGKPYGRLRVLTLADAESAPPRHYLLRGLIAPGELSLWWGAPKCGKSFLLLRLAYGLALGRGMWGRKAKPCRVLYVAAEGEGGFAARLLVLRKDMGDAGEAFRYIAQRATVGPPADDLEDVIAAARDMGANVIVLDTLARTFGEGDENAARDMGGFVASVDRLRTETGAHVAVIHHGTKEGGSSRGSGALVGAADLIVKVAKGAQGEPNTATVEAAKDDADGAALAFRLRLVDLPPGVDREPRQTCIAEEAEGEGQRRKPPSGVPRQALRTLADLIVTEGQPIPTGALMPDDMKGVREERWREECDARRLSVAGNSKDRDRVFRRAAKDLRDAGEIAMRDGWVWMLRDGEDAGGARVSL
ncbi:AAA family ATPase [Falsiroseomonas oryziterrae]|uniref:AAA family ATPase n=1 Tax=Falsiroseomonas oryziterrae TaxID=2911368 RepID=UPI001F36A15D|nr:AAA family ATPase [Roseomonas sp. NPKOSM-4]